MRLAIWALVSLLCVSTASGQSKTDSTKRTKKVDSTLVQGGVYNRPFIASLGQASIGGYAEANSNYSFADGVSEGLSMEMRRFNIFLFAPLGDRLRFLSELEFEHGTEEIALETAQLDFEIGQLLVLRGGILLPPIGAFNANHDSPRWDFIERPLVSTRIIPATLSEVGFGGYGRFQFRGTTVTYDAYLTNGLGDGVVLNDEGRTLLAAGKREEQFAEDNNGSPALSGRVALRQSRFGEVGLSHYRCIYNSFRLEGFEIDEKRSLSITAIDAHTTLWKLELRGEAASVRVEVPDGLSELFGERQWGAHLDAVAPIWFPKISGLPGAVLNAVFRIERVDYHDAKFSSTGRSVRDDVTAYVPGLSFRPTPEAVIKLNMRIERIRDFAGNDPARVVNYQAGFATYF